MSHKFQRVALLRAVKLVDLGAVSLTFLAALAIGSGSLTWPSFAVVLFMRIKLVNILVFTGYLAFCSMVFSSCGFCVSHRMSRWSRQCRETFLATTLITLAFLVLPLRMEFATRSFYTVFWLLSFSVLFLARLIGQQLLVYLRSRGRNQRNIVIVGEGLDAAKLGDRVEQDPTLGYQLVRIIDAELYKAPETAVLDQFKMLISREAIDEVLLALPT